VRLAKCPDEEPGEGWNCRDYLHVSTLEVPSSSAKLIGDGVKKHGRTVGESNHRPDRLDTGGCDVLCIGWDNHSTFKLM
jgi:hypothetical protein